MREWWATVYRDRVTGHPIVGSRWGNRRAAIRADEGFPPTAQFRIHVRLKPEGAPKRYREAVDRYLWEVASDWCRKQDRRYWE